VNGLTESSDSWRQFASSLFCKYCDVCKRLQHSNEAGQESSAGQVQTLHPTAGRTINHDLPASQRARQWRGAGTSARVCKSEAGRRVRTLPDDGATGPWKRCGCRSSECQDRRRANSTCQGIWRWCCSCSVRTVRTVRGCATPHLPFAHLLNVLKYSPECCKGRVTTRGVVCGCRSIACTRAGSLSTLFSSLPYPIHSQLSHRGLVLVLLTGHSQSKGYSGQFLAHTHIRTMSVATQQAPAPPAKEAKAAGHTKGAASTSAAAAPRKVRVFTVSRSAVPRRARR